MEKLTQIRNQFENLNIDALLITSKYNRRYVTGFTGSTGVAFISKNQAIFITDFRYTEQAKKQIKGFEIIENRDMFGEVAKLVSRFQIERLGLEQDEISYRQFNELKKIVEATCVPVSNVIEEVRKIKTTDEIEKIRTAAEISDYAFTKILDFIRPGITEKEINHQLEFYMRQQGAKSSSFDSIIASGYRSALPHGSPSNKPVEKGDMLTLDFGAYYEGYCSDMTRTVAVGEPSQKLREIYDIVLDALQLGIKEIKNNIKCEDVDRVIRDYITNADYGEYFGHGSGHAIGLEIHEAPYFSQKSDEYLKTGMVMTVEPGIYLSGIGGVRIEDDILVTNDGCEVLTQSPKELIIL